MQFTKTLKSTFVSIRVLEAFLVPAFTTLRREAAKFTSTMISKGKQKSSSPIQNLPMEILCLIYARVDATNAFGPSTAQSEAASLGSVCRRWRSAALATHEIWSNIQLSIRCTRIRAYPKHVLDTLELHLSRAGKQPLFLTVSWEGPSPKRGVGIEAKGPGLLDTILSRSKNWERLAITLGHDSPHNTCFQFIQSRVMGAISTLRTLTLRLEGTQDGYNFPSPSDRSARQIVRDLLKANPLLSTFNFSSTFINYPILPFKPDPDFPFGQITHINLYLKAGLTRKVTKLCPNLVSARFSVEPSLDGPYEYDYNIIDGQADGVRKDHNDHLPNLQELTIEVLDVPDPYEGPHKRSKFYMAEDSSFWDSQRVIELLTCPKLEFLALVSDSPQTRRPYFGSNFYTNSITSFLRRSKATRSLKRLHIDGMPITGQCLVKILQLTPCLVELNVVEAEPSDERRQNCLSGRSHSSRCALTTSPILLKEMIISPSRGCKLLPDLERMKMKVYSDWTDNLFETMVESRSPSSVFPLEHVELSVVDNTRYLQLIRLLKMKQDGMGIIVRFGEGEEEEEMIGLGMGSYDTEWEAAELRADNPASEEGSEEDTMSTEGDDER
ncbi:hypothetical protein V5O48_006395 [Marasmius crinis-equi]|uniref:F-box domain-containing protein n=1 Tax=Marasmius crinis-equi TaxID=585013 RepID=A0ABR3FJL5_9AGAR